MLQPLLDNPLPNPMVGNTTDRLRSMKAMGQLVKLGYRHRETIVPFYELLTGPADQLLNRWFDSEILKTTLATDAGNPNLAQLNPELSQLNPEL